jgi:hypothetical protein
MTEEQQMDQAVMNMELEWEKLKGLVNGLLYETAPRGVSDYLPLLDTHTLTEVREEVGRQIIHRQRLVELIDEDISRRSVGGGGAPQ